MAYITHCVFVKKFQEVKALWWDGSLPNTNLLLEFLKNFEANLNSKRRQIIPSIDLERKEAIIKTHVDEIELVTKDFLDLVTNVKENGLAQITETGLRAKFGDELKQGFNLAQQAIHLHRAHVNALREDLTDMYELKEQFEHLLHAQGNQSLESQKLMTIDSIPVEQKRSTISPSAANFSGKRYDGQFITTIAIAIALSTIYDYS